MFSRELTPDMKSLILNLTLLHKYYQNGLMQNINLVADRNTQLAIQRYRLLPHNTTGQYSLYHMGNSTPQSLIKTLKSFLNGAPLTFFLIPTQSNFMVISDLPINWCGQLHYSSQRTSSGGESDAVALIPELIPLSDISNGAVARVDIYPEDLMDNETGNLHCLFSIQIKNRQTHWHYYVFNRSKVKMNAPAITDFKGFDFDSGKHIESKDNVDVWLFTSGERVLPLQEKIEHPFNLVNYTDSSYMQMDHGGKSKVKFLLGGLPLPNTEEINIKLYQGEQYVCSEMYVYV